jgi:hypothetical protein
MKAILKAENTSISHRMPKGYVVESYDYAEGKQLRQGFELVSIDDYKNIMSNQDKLLEQFRKQRQEENRHRAKELIKKEKFKEKPKKDFEKKLKQFDLSVFTDEQKDIVESIISYILKDYRNDNTG